MKLDIKTPSYYEQHYHIDEEIICMCNDITEHIKSKEFSEIIKVVDIVPVVAPPEKLEQGLWGEDIMFSKSIGRISVFKHIDYDKYMNGTIEERKKLTIKCVVEAIWMIKKRPGTKFNAKQFEVDLLEFVGCNKEELELKMMKNFRISMNSNTFNDRPITEQLIREAIDYVRNRTMMRNYEFFTLINEVNESFIQFVLEQDGYHVEIRYPDIEEKGIYVKKILSYEEMISKFYDFYKGKMIDTSGYEDISYYLK